MMSRRILPVLVSVFCVGSADASQLMSRATLQKPSAMMSIEKVKNLVERNNIVDLDDLPGVLPKEFRLNFVLKHGREIRGPRGHLFEVAPEGLGQGADPNRPRAILFDENNGFSVSYNGSLRQKNGHTFDMMEFDRETGFHFWKYDFDGQNAPDLNQKSCTVCHGPKERSRPIFSMYPDWPGFYGSDNDEMTNPDIRQIRLSGYSPFLAAQISPKHQENEYHDFKRFRETNGARFKRYRPLFSSAEKREMLGYDKLISKVQVEPGRKVVRFSQRSDGRIDPRRRTGAQVIAYPWDYVFQLYPYRPAHTLVSTRDISRAFSFRAGLRFNILTSRYHALNLKRMVVQHPNFQRFGKFFLYNLMSCSPESGDKVAEQKIRSYFSSATSALSQIRIPDDFGIDQVSPSDPRRSMLKVSGRSLVRTKNHFTATGPRQTLMEYERAWMLMGLELRDIDMRYSYGHPAYQNYQKRRSLGQINTEGDLMRVGYFGTYFNAYNDGSTTIDELMAGHLVEHLVRTDASFNGALKAATKDIRWSYVESIVNEGRVIRVDANGNPSNGKKVSQTFFVDRPGIENDSLNLWGFAQKYGRFPARYTLDRSFFKKMDQLGRWINLPYAEEIKDDHHRAPWNTNRDTGKKGDIFESIYKGVCESLIKSS